MSSQGKRKLVRGIVLLLVLLVPLVFLTYAFFTREPNLICGNWWYGVMIFEFVSIYLMP